jgi:hypothetical protein
MQIQESHSWTTSESENQTGLSPTPSSCPSDYAHLKDSQKKHLQMVDECLEGFVMNDTPIPTGPKEPFDRVPMANLNRCQQSLTWHHLSDDSWPSPVDEWGESLWGDSQITIVKKWLDGTTEHAVEVHQGSEVWFTEPAEFSGSASSTTSSTGSGSKFSSPVRPTFTEIEWNPPVELYSPSVYSQCTTAVSPGNPGPLGAAVWDQVQPNEMPLFSPRQCIIPDEMHALAANTADLCVEVRAKVPRGQVSAKSDAIDSNSDLSLLEIVEPLPTSGITLNDIASGRGLTILDSDATNSNGGSEHNSNGTNPRNDNANSLSQSSGQRGRTSSTQSSIAHSTQSYVRTRPTLPHHVSSEILNRMAYLANSGFTV